MLAMDTKWLNPGTTVRICVPEYDRNGMTRVAEISSAYQDNNGAGYTLYLGTRGEVFRSTEIVDVEFGPR